LRCFRFSEVRGALAEAGYTLVAEFGVTLVFERDGDAFPFPKPDEFGLYDASVIEQIFADRWLAIPLRRLTPIEVPRA